MFQHLENQLLPFFSGAHWLTQTKQDEPDSTFLPQDDSKLMRWPVKYMKAYSPGRFVSEELFSTV